MPAKLEHNLERGAREHGFKKGSKRYNAYVYGYMNEHGFLRHNHAGNLGPDKILKDRPKLKLDYEPSIKGVHGIHIGIMVAVIFLLYLAIFGNPFKSGVSTDLLSWWDIQYNSLGAHANADVGESN